MDEEGEADVDEEIVKMDSDGDLLRVPVYLTHHNVVLEYRDLYVCLDRDFKGITREGVLMKTFFLIFM